MSIIPNVMEMDAYLERISYHGSRVANAETLRALQVAHLLTVPFENLSIHAGEPIVLTDEALFDKIVTRRRGGFCYELNGLFAALLRTLGYKVGMLSAGVADEADFGPDFDHMVLMVSLEQRWLVDVGFGDSFREPLLLEYGREQDEARRSYKILSDNGHLTLVRRESNGEWKNQFRFTLTPHEYPDYAAMCHYHQTSPESHFTRGRICTRATTDGRITLSEMRLIATDQFGVKQERLLKDDEEYRRTLKDIFGIVM